MNVVLFGATGMVGQGVLRECLVADDVLRVTSVVRRASGQPNAKLREVVPTSFTDFASIEAELAGTDACFFCLGVTSVGLSEEQYRAVTYDIAVAAANTLARLNPSSTFVFVSGAGSDSTERGRVMWARVKGAAENAVLRLPFKGYVFRPGLIQPMHGITSRTKLYRVLYPLIAPVVPLLTRFAPGLATTTERVGRAMLHVARHGYQKRILESADINGAAVRAG